MRQPARGRSGDPTALARAVDELLGREVAVKVMRAYTDASAVELADLRTRMQREAQAAARIRHGGVHDDRGDLGRQHAKEGHEKPGDTHPEEITPLAAHAKYQ